MMINKIKVWRYMNISDGVFIFCVILGVLFFRDSVLGVIGMWFAAFLCSGLGLRLYCKGKGMMRYGTINNVDENDIETIMESYRAHRDTMIGTTTVAVIFTLYQLYHSSF
ncbi:MULTISPECIES: hypothetical protein [Gammaproteobacteria]|nr:MULTISPECIES: hypothetical protein [Gammaproteobacteria]EGQ8536570.1 hypothetical protein [Vibrio parahaemolyticus]MCZ6289603.1 hypothetical protein [Vibrio parahaemolyticus]MDF5039188.1 hypothetical protein [Vibrio parahaemolyticus]MDF5109587.1 hypothetical protein [Vibrio parahaemolyticus]MDF5653011.1 hypothetical protein [Vibrio parahaemolyticus]